MTPLNEKGLTDYIRCECDKPIEGCSIHRNLLTEQDAELDLKLADLRREAERTRTPEVRIILHLLAPVLMTIVRRLRVVST